MKSILSPFVAHATSPIRLTGIVAGFVIFMAATTPLRAELIQIGMPNADYLAATTLLPITDSMVGHEVPSLTDGVQTISFLGEPSPVALEVPDSWAGWNDPPWVETATPNVLFPGMWITGVTLTLAVPSRIFGVEMTGNWSSSGGEPVWSHLYASFFDTTDPSYDPDNPVPLDTIVIYVKAAQLCAAYSTTNYFDTINLGINFLDDDTGFGMAQFRYGQPLPEPSSLVLLGIAGLGAVGYGWRKHRLLQRRA